MYGPTSGGMGIGLVNGCQPMGVPETCKNTQTSEQLSRLGKSLGRLNDLKEALENVLSPVLRCEPKCENRPEVGVEQEPLVPLADAISRFHQNVNATCNSLEDIIRRVEL